MNRWKVEGVYGEHQLSPFEGGGSKTCTRWVAIYDGEDELSSTCVEFGTHAEAIAYADRMARTVEFEIPREPHRAGRYTLRSHQAGIQLRHKEWPEKRGEMTIVHTEVKDLALALLAHHYGAVDNPQ